MSKKIFKIIIISIVIILIALVVAYLVDRNRMNNNEPIVFSTWGYDYAPPETLYPNGDNNNSSVEEYYFYGKVVESSLKYIIVEPNEGEDVRKSADKISIGLGENNDALYMNGTNVKITYSGYIMETYPAKINASKIELVSKLELMYETIIDDIIAQDEALNNNAKYISLDVDSFVAPIERGEGTIQSEYLGLNESEKDTLLRYCKKYNSDIKDYSMQELREKGLFNEEEVRIDGILIYISNVEKITENSAIMTVGKYRSGLGAIFPKYKLTYRNGSWDIEVIQMAIS